MQTEGERVRGAGSGAQLQERPAVHPYKIDVDQGVLEDARGSCGAPRGAGAVSAGHRRHSSTRRLAERTLNVQRWTEMPTRRPLRGAARCRELVRSGRASRSSVSTRDRSVSHPTPRRRAMPAHSFAVARYAEDDAATTCASRLARTRLDARDNATVDAADWDAGAELRRISDELRRVLALRVRLARARGADQPLRSLSRHAYGGASLHFIHERGRGDSPLPLVLTHGYPDSFLRFVKLIPLLTDPAAPRRRCSTTPSTSSCRACRAFGFSRAADRKDGHASSRSASLWHELMTDELGYERFARARRRLG